MMFKSMVFFAVVAVVACDVSHLFNKPSRNFGSSFPNRPYQKTPQYQAYKPQVYTPVRVVPQAYTPVRAVPQPIYHPESAQSGGILRQESDIHPDGSYNWAYETQNGISANEQASVTHLGPDTASKTAQGGYQYTSPEGQVVQISYVADENGFQPIGDAIPTPHPIPVAIQRAIQYIEANQGRAVPNYRN